MYIRCIEFVVDVYNQFTAWALRNKTHEENTPWDIVYNKNNNKNGVIPKYLIREFFVKYEVEV